MRVLSWRCAGLCKIWALLAAPGNGIGKVQLSPDATLMSAVEFSPQSASSIDLEHSGAANALETYVGLEAPAINATTARLDSRITSSSICDQLTCPCSALSSSNCSRWR